MESDNPLYDLVGQTDIYLLDQVQKGRFNKNMLILDAGCGSGRNLHYFLKQGYNVSGIDASREAIAQTIQLKDQLKSSLPDHHFQVAAVESMPFDNFQFDVVISSAVLHFAKDEDHFNQMVDEMWRVLQMDGILFCRLASSIGIEKRIMPLQGRHYLLPDGTKRFLADETMLLRKTHALGATFLEPIKTVNVQHSRCMTTWVLKKQ